MFGHSKEKRDTTKAKLEPSFGKAVDQGQAPIPHPGILYRMRMRLCALEVQQTERVARSAEAELEMKTLAGEIHWLTRHPDAANIIEDIERSDHSSCVASRYVAPIK